MTRALTSVGSPLHSADGPARRSMTGLRGRAGVRRSIEGLRRRITNHCISNRNKVRIEIAVTYSKQTRGTKSNRNSFRGSSERRGKNSHRRRVTNHSEMIVRAKANELVKVTRHEGSEFDCAPWVHKAKELPKEEFRREVERHLTGR
jgi:hypothetical protein